MTALLIVLAVLAALLLARLGARIEYDDGGPRVYARVIGLSFQLYPFKKAKKQRKKSASAPKEKKTPEAASKHESIDLRRFLDIFVDVARRFKNGLTINLLRIHYISGASDAASAAIGYGAAWAAIGAITPLLESCFKIKERDLAAQLDYNAKSPRVEFKAVMTVAVWQGLYISLHFLLAFMKRQATIKAESKAEKLTGTAPDKP